MLGVENRRSFSTTPTSPLSRVGRRGGGGGGGGDGDEIFRRRHFCVSPRLVASASLTRDIHQNRECAANKMSMTTFFRRFCLYICASS